MTLRQKLEQQGVQLEPKLTFKSSLPLDAETLATLQANKAELLRDLTAPDSLPRLPWQLERLLGAAASDLLPKDTVALPSGLVPNLNPYVLAWAASYLTGDRDEALRRLWEAHRAWRGTN